MQVPKHSSQEPFYPARLSHQCLAGAAIFVLWIQLLGSAVGAAVLMHRRSGRAFTHLGLWLRLKCAGSIGGWEDCQAHSVPVLSYPYKCNFLEVLLQKWCFEHLCCMYLSKYMLTLVLCVNDVKRRNVNSNIFNHSSGSDTFTVFMSYWWHYGNAPAQTEEGLNMVQLKQVPAAIAACLRSVWPEFRSLFLTRVNTAVCGAGSVLLLCSEGFPVGFSDWLPWQCL